MTSTCLHKVLPTTDDMVRGHDLSRQVLPVLHKGWLFQPEVELFMLFKQLSPIPSAVFKSLPTVEPWARAKGKDFNTARGAKGLITIYDIDIAHY